MWFLCATVAPDDTAPILAGALAGPFVPNTAPTVAIGGSGNFTDQDINGLLSGQAWGTLALTFSFPTQASFYGGFYGDPAPGNGFQPLSAAQQDVARYAFGLLAEYSQLTFTEVTETASVHAAIRLAGSASPSTSYAYLPGPFSRDGDVWFGNIRNTDPIRGSYAYATFLHEIGHAIGFKHGHVSQAPYGVLPAAHNSTEWSVMSYMSYLGAGGSFYENAEGSGNQTYAIDDIAALQYVYGANFNTRAGNTVYTWNPATGEMSIDGVGQGASSTNTAYAAIWDGNGSDTYDLSNYTTSLSLDLRPGEWSTFDPAQLASLGVGQLAHGNLANAHLYMNSDTRSLIEAAIGGSGHDTLRGNVAANTLSGGNGNDTLRGDLGDDLLDGGAGSDTVVLAGSPGDYVFTWLGGTTYQSVGPDGTDTLVDIEYVQFGAGAPAAVAAACFVPGTLIATPTGLRPVEALRIGDLVATHVGPARPVRWIGRRSYDAATVAANPQLHPVRVCAGALGGGLPARDLLLSPQHAVRLDGPEGKLLVPVAALVNGASIAQEAWAEVRYFHIELDRHALILAEGAPVESFGDAAARALFDNAAEFRLLYPDADPMPAALPRSEEGFAVEAARRRLAGIAPAPIVPGPLRGMVERLANGVIEGWAMDAANPARPVELELLTALGPRRILANRWRDDLRRAAVGSARHGFRAPVGPQAGAVVVRRRGDGQVLPWAGG